jgi:hypothetical protein
MIKLWGREPALWASLFGIALKLAVAFGLHASVDVQSAANAAVVAALGLYVAYATHDGLAAAILGFAQAGLALAIGLGLHWSPEVQATTMSFVAAVVGMFVRTQVTAPVPAGVPLKAVE